MTLVGPPDADISSFRQFRPLVAFRFSSLPSLNSKLTPVMVRNLHCTRGTTTRPFADVSSGAMNTLPPGSPTSRARNFLPLAFSAVMTPSSTKAGRPSTANVTSVPLGEVTWTLLAPWSMSRTADVERRDNAVWGEQVRGIPACLRRLNGQRLHERDGMLSARDHDELARPHGDRRCDDAAGEPVDVPLLGGGRGEGGRYRGDAEGEP